MTKFPTTINTASNAKALHHTIPSAFEGRSSEDVLLEIFEDEVFFILFGLRLYEKCLHFTAGREVCQSVVGNRVVFISGGKRTKVA